MVKGTNMVDYIEQLHDQLQNAAEVDFAKLRTEATSRYTTLKTHAEPVMRVIEDPEAVEKLRNAKDKDLTLQSEYNVSV